MTNDTDDINSFSRLSCPLDGLFCEAPVRGFWPLKKIGCLLFSYFFLGVLYIFCFFTLLKVLGLPGAL